MKSLVRMIRSLIGVKEKRTQHSINSGSFHKKTEFKNILCFKLFIFRDRQALTKKGTFLFLKIKNINLIINDLANLK